jgi:hypothetical protein
VYHALFRFATLFAGSSSPAAAHIQPDRGNAQYAARWRGSPSAPGTTNSPREAITCHQKLYSYALTIVA